MTKTVEPQNQGMGRMIRMLCGDSIYSNMTGRTLVSVSLENNKQTLVFKFTDGEKRFGVEGDCCSESWIEHLELPGDVAGLEIIDILEAPVLDQTDNDSMNPVGELGREHECLQVYQTVFRTAKGDISVEYRNSSNGYYGGYLVGR